MKQLNRRVYAIVGVIVLLFAGLVYAWSVLSTPIAAEFTGWTKAQLSLTFTLVMILFCIGSLLCGLLAGKLSAKNAVRLGAVLFLAGFYIASRCQTPLTLYLGFGVLCGLGSGLSYNAVMSTMVKWFPDKPGLISGVLLMGFGGGSFLIGKLYQAWTPAAAGAPALWCWASCASRCWRCAPSSSWRPARTLRLRRARAARPPSVPLQRTSSRWRC